ncbi:MAG: phosphoribosylformylglycinamidine synthase subunit PurL, partial [Alicyclobacillus sp.]|nr:phosphoribosylformylglycinamidine synthase subunit PurL [Alicyclobacillus sp.]
PIALLNSLRFGDLSDEHTRYLFAQVVAGIGGYGNCIGVPTVGGETVFDPVYTRNPLVNAMCVGVLRADRIVRGVAAGTGNPVFVMGARTGRDGIHGATFASAQDPQEKERSAVQVGDPFFGKLLLEATLELLAEGRVVGVQDMGAAGITSSAAEMASRAGGGMELYLERVPVREAGMTPYEIMLSESQERMLVVVERGGEAAARAVARKWGLDLAEIGRVTDDGLLRLWFHGEQVAAVPVRALVDEAPRYQRPQQPPAQPPGKGVPLPPAEASLNDAFLELLSHPNIADKRWVYRQYDWSVRAATYVGPGADAAVVRLPDGSRGVALSADGNGRYTFLNPRRGGAIAVAEAARNVVCAGGKPLALTNCLNFGNPEKPAVMYQLAEAIAGMSEACRALDTPVVSGNVSLYNESGGVDIYPTPVVGMVGVVEDWTHVTPNAFRQAGSAVLLVGPDDPALDGSLYWQLRAGRAAGDAPQLDLAMERRVQDLVRSWIVAGQVLAAHDVSEGGLAVALAEMCIPAGLGVQAQVADQPVADGVARAGWLFGEGQSRILVEVDRTAAASLLAAAAAAGVPARVLGSTGGERLRLGDSAQVWVDVPLQRVADTWRQALPQQMRREEGEADAVS